MDRQVVSYSQLKEFRQCPHAWSKQYVDGLVPKYDKPALRFGTLYHAAVEGVAHALDAGECGYAVRDHAMQALNAKLLDYVKQWGGSFEELTSEIYDDLQLIGNMAARCADGIKHGMDRGEVLLATELSFEVPVLDVKGREHGLYYKGTIDALWARPGSGTLIVDDHKTTSGSVLEEEDKLEFDGQMPGYAYALQRMVASGELEKRLSHRLSYLGLSNRQWSTGAVRFRVARKKEPAIPDMLKVGKYSARANIDSTFEIYEACLQSQEASGIPRTEPQSAVLEGLRGRNDRFYREWTMSLGKEELERWRQEVWCDARRMRQLRKENLYPRTYFCTHSKYKGCAYQHICTDDTPEVRAELYKLKAG